MVEEGINFLKYVTSITFRLFTNKTEGGIAGIINMEVVNPVTHAKMAELEFQYGAEALEAHQQKAAKALTSDKAAKNAPVKTRYRKSSFKLNKC